MKEILSIIYFQNNSNKRLPYIQVCIKDIIIKVHYTNGGTIEHEYTCGSTYILLEMRRVGASIRLKFHWVHMRVILYIVLDNIGGYGTDLCVAQYTAILRAEFNITLIHQVPHIPYCNALDLGLWCSLYAQVEKF